MQTHFTLYPSPIGTLRLRATDTGLTAVDHPNQQHTTDPTWQETPTHPILKQATQELNEYFAEQRTEFKTPLYYTGTPFQNTVWTALKTIPYGTTISYLELAQKIQNPKAIRAVGTANGKNPLSIFIPCHRVIGKNGTLTGYAGGLIPLS